MTTVPTDTEGVYATFGRTIRELVESEGFERRVRQFDRTIQFALTDPQATVTARCKGSGPLQVDFGKTSLTPEIVLRTSSEKACELLLGELNVFLAVDRGEMAFEGDPTPFLLLIPRMVMFGAPRYRTHAERTA
jgi:hypothetical protein